MLNVSIGYQYIILVINIYIKRKPVIGCFIKPIMISISLSSPYINEA